jgi:LysR family glycine cleavage system transcriptional activator
MVGEGWRTKVMTGKGMHINNLATAIQASTEGRGIALGQSVMARDDVVSGRLARRFPEIEFQ